MLGEVVRQYIREIEQDNEEKTYGTTLEGFHEL